MNMKQNKGGILRTTVDYVKTANERRLRYKKLKRSYNQLVAENRSLIDQLAQWQRKFPPQHIMDRPQVIKSVI